MKIEMKYEFKKRRMDDDTKALIAGVILIGVAMAIMEAIFGPCYR